MEKLIEVPFIGNQAPKGKKAKKQLAGAEKAGTPQFSSLTEGELEAWVMAHEFEIPGWRDLDLDGKRKVLAGMFGQVMISMPSVVFSDTAAQATPETFGEIVAEIESISSESEAVEAVLLLRDSKTLSDIRVGGVLCRMRENCWQGGSPDFYAFVFSTFQIDKRKAQSLIQIYHELTELGDVDWNKFKGLGWGKLRTISPILTVENYETVLSEIAGMKSEAIVSYVKNYKAKLCGNAEGELISTRFTFMVTASQAETIKAALERAQKEGKTDIASYALELICIFYLNSGTVPAPPTMLGMLEDLRAAHTEPADGLRELIELARVVWPGLIAE